MNMAALTIKSGERLVTDILPNVQRPGISWRKRTPSVSGTETSGRIQRVYFIFHPFMPAEDDGIFLEQSTPHLGSPPGPTLPCERSMGPQACSWLEFQGVGSGPCVSSSMARQGIYDLSRFLPNC